MAHYQRKTKRGGHPLPETLRRPEYLPMRPRLAPQLSANDLMIHRGIDLHTHRAAGMRYFIAPHTLITSFHLPPYAPGLNPVEGIRSLLRRSSQTNAAFTDPDQFIRHLRHDLREIRYRPGRDTTKPLGPFGPRG